MKRTGIPRDPEAVRAWNEKHRKAPTHRAASRVLIVGEKYTRGDWYGTRIPCHAPDCDHRRTKLDRHHVVYLQHVLDAGGEPWDPRNRMGVHRPRHMAHHDGSARLSASAIPDAAVAFAAELLGAGAAYEYLRRYYRDDGDPRVAALIA